MSTTTLAPVLVTLVALVVWVYCLVDFTRTDEGEMRTFTKPVWLVILVLGNAVGGLVWLAVGRPQRR